MKKFFPLISCVLLLSCQHDSKAPSQQDSTARTQQASKAPIEGSWRLVSASSITKGVSTETDYTGNTRMIKMLNGTHFAFIKHDINLPKDSANHFDAGGGSYTLNGDQYTEHLDFYKDRNWEGQTFHFTVSFHGDTLIQR